MDRTDDPSQASFWQNLYRSGGDGWELGQPSPPLARWFAAHPPAGLRVLVPGCGRGHEARLLARGGAEVTAIDLASDAIDAARALAEKEKVQVDFRVADLFELPSEPGQRGRYQRVVEHTCFCAIAPARRDEYVRAASALLAPDGELIGLFYAHGRPGGPPFTTTREELEQRFGERFETLSIEVAPDSIERRQGQELLLRLRRRPTSP